MVEIDDSADLLMQEGIEIALAGLENYGVGELQPREDMTGKRISARWDHVWRWDSTRGWFIKSRYVAREFRWQDQRDDLFTPGSTHNENRVIDHLSLKHGLPSFTVDAVDAYYHADEEEDVYTEAPPEVLAAARAKGDTRDLVWRLRKQLPGRRQA